MLHPAQQKLIESHSRWSLHYLTGHDIEWFIPKIVRPVLYLTVLNMVFYIVSALPTLGYKYEAVFLPIIFIIEIITFGWLGWQTAFKASYKTLPKSMKLATAALTGALAGLFLGIFVTLFKIFWYRDLWTIYNIATEPAVRFFEGLIMAGIVGLITLIFARREKKETEII